LEYFLSIDIGTTSIKVGIFGIDGRLKAVSTQEYSLLTPSSDVVELPVNVYWEALRKGVREVLKKSKLHPQSVIALSISSQAETLICIDKKGKVLRNAIVWLDNRAVTESSEISRNFPKEILYKITGLPEMSPMWPASKILWLKRNEPYVFNQTSKFLIVKDYLIWKLTEEFSTEPTSSSSTCYLKLKQKDWWDDMLDFIGIKRNRLPPIFSSYEVVGNISSKVSSELGLSINTKVVAGSMDQMAAALGAGNIEPGVITESTGTALAVIACVDKPTFDLGGKVPCAPHCVPGKFVLMPYSQTSGIVLRWFRDTFGINDKGEKKSYDALMQLAKTVPAGSEGLLALPHFTGTFCPDFNSEARGAFVGISFNHKKAHFVRALVESISFMLRENVELLKNLGVKVEKVKSLGGAAKSDFWLQVKSDVLNLPIDLPKCSEAASLGAAILAGVGTKVYRSVDDAVKIAVSTKKTFIPQPKNVVVYQEAFRNYLNLYQKLYGKIL